MIRLLPAVLGGQGVCDHHPPRPPPSPMYHSQDDAPTPEAEGLQVASETLVAIRNTANLALRTIAGLMEADAETLPADRDEPSTFGG